MKSGKIAGETITQNEKNVAKRYERAMRHTMSEVSLVRWMPPKEISNLIVKFFLSNVSAKLPFGLNSLFRRHFLKKFFKYYDLPQNTHYALIDKP
jgi:hypothetical protein